jgi:hypothetical protein
VPIIVSAAISGAAIVSGVIFTASAASSHSSYVSQPNNDVALSGERSVFIADISYGVAALFGLTALALYFFPDDEEPAPASTAPAKAASSNNPKHPSNAGAWYTAPLRGTLLQF